MILLSYCNFFFIKPFLLLVPISYSSLYLVNSPDHILHCYSLSIILTSSNNSRWFPFSFHIWSVIPDFSISSHITDFQCSSCFNFCGWYVSLWYTLPWLHRMEYTQFLVMLYSVRGLTQKKYFWKSRHTWILSYHMIFWNFSATPLT